MLLAANCWKYQEGVDIFHNTADVHVYGYNVVDELWKLEGMCLTSLREYRFQKRAVPRLEPSTGMCDELYHMISK